MRRRRRDTTFTHENDVWIPVYQAIARQLSEVLPPSEETASALISVADAEDLRALYQDHLRPEITEEGPDRRFVRSEVDTLDRIVEAWSARQDEQGLRQSLINLVRQGDLGAHWTVLRVLRERLAPTGSYELPHPEAARNLAARLELSPLEERVLVVLYALSQGDELERALDSVVGRTAVRAFAAVCGLSSGETAQALAPGGRLDRLGLVDHRRGPGRELLHDATVDPAVSSYFSSDSQDVLEAGVFAEERGPGYTLQDFPVGPSDRQFLTAALGSGRPVLLYGHPGIGKTEFAYALGGVLGRRVRSVAMNDGEGGRGGGSGRSKLQGRLQLIRRAVRLVDREQDLLLIDEADALLQGAGGVFSLLTGVSVDKGELNELLDEITVPCIWIANDTSQMPASAFRRFGYVYEFPRPRQATRVRMLHERLTDRGITADTPRLRRIAARYDLSPSAIDRMVHVVSEALGDERAGDERHRDGTAEGEPEAGEPIGDEPVGDEREAVAGDRDSGAPDGVADSRRGAATTHRFYERMEEYLSRTSRGALSRETRRLPTASEHFDPALCNTSHALTDLLSRLERRTQKGRASRMLFHGPPGGGKTEFALYVAQELGREPVVRRPSDLLSPYVGVAEKNIAAMFREYAGNETVLILDEADALLAGREGAQRSWELTQAAEFLQGLQSFEGILIACTNRVAAMDPALRRRFHQSVEFGPLRRQQLCRALERFFPAVAWTDRDLARMSGGPPIMVSDVATAADLLENSANPEAILTEIAANARSRDMTRSIGFGAGG